MKSPAVIKFFQIFVGINFVLAALTANAQTLADQSFAGGTVQVFGDAKIVANQSRFGTDAVIFDGVEDYLTITPSPLANNPSAMTIEAWIYIDTVPANGWPIVSQSTNQAASMQRFYVSGSSSGSQNVNKLRFTRESGLGNSVDLISAATVPLAQWVHVALVGDGKTLKLFINGVPDTSVTSSVNWGDVSGSFLVGASVSGADSSVTAYSMGKMSDLRVTKASRYKTAFIPSATSQINLQESDKYWGDNSLILQAENTTNIKEASDSSRYLHLLKASGDAAISTNLPKFGSGAFKFDGSGDYFSMPSNEQFTFAENEPFTMEAWVYLNGDSAVDGSGFRRAAILSASQASNETGYWTLSIGGDSNTTGTSLYFWRSMGSGTLFEVPYTFSKSTWYHLAVSRTTTELSLYVNGQKIGSSTNFQMPIGASSNTVSLGANVLGTNNTYKQFLNGYIDDVRITKGVARYLTSFTPQAIPNTPEMSGDSSYAKTSLLLNANGDEGSKTLYEYSKNAVKASFGGNAKLSQIQKKFGSASVYFGGGGSVSFPYADSFNLGGDDFTIEGNIFVNAMSGSSQYGTVLSKRQSGGDFDYVVFLNGSCKCLVFSYGTSSSARINLGTSTNSVPLSTWINFAIVRDKNNLRMYINGHLEAEQVVSETLRNRGNPIELGASLGYSDGYFNGYIDDLRLTRNIARYSGDYVPNNTELLPPQYLLDPFSSSVRFLLGSVVSVPTISRPKILSIEKELTEESKLSAIYVNTNIAIDETTFTPSQVTVKDGSQNSVLLSTDKITSTRFKILFNRALSAGDYTLTLSQNLMTTAGVALDQNENNISGELADAYSELIKVPTIGLPVSTNILDQSQLKNNVFEFGNVNINTGNSLLGNVAGLFNTANDYLIVSPSPLKGKINELTLESWIYIDSIDAGGWPIFSQSKLSPTGEQWFGVSTDGKLQFVRGLSFGSPINIKGTSTLPIGQWIHVAVSADGSNINLYVNGALDASAANNLAWEETNEPFYVGKLFTGGAPLGIHGKLSNLVITQAAKYKTAFTPGLSKTIDSSGEVASFYQTTTLINADGPNNSTYVYDSSDNPKPFYTSGNVKLSTTSSISGGSSLWFDGSNSYVYSSPNSDFELLGDFTVEAWVKSSLGTTSDRVILNVGGHYGSLWSHWIVVLGADGKFYASLGKNQSTPNQNTVFSTSSIQQNTWTHVAFVREGDKLKLFINGIKEAETLVTITPTYAKTLGLWIGRNHMTPSSYNWAGYIDNVRIIKGKAIYSDNFTPATTLNTPALVGDLYSPYTYLLLNGNGVQGSNKIVDSSYFPKTVTPVGGVSIDTNNKKFGSGSIKFNGSTDYLSLPASSDFAFGTRDFTVETWLYINGDSPIDVQNARHMAIFESQNPAGAFQLLVQGSNTETGTGLLLYDGPKAQAYYIPAKISKYTWHHVAFVRHSGYFKYFLDGKLIGLTANTTDFSSTEPRLIGYQNQSGMPRYFNGWMDDFRITNGVARYTENFVPSGTQLSLSDWMTDPYSSAVNLLLFSQPKAPLPFPVVTSTSASATLSSSVQNITVKFNSSIDPASFTAQDISLKNQDNISQVVHSVESLSDKEFSITLAAPLAEGKYQLTVGPNISNTNGLLMDQNANFLAGESTDLFTQDFSVELPCVSLLLNGNGINNSKSIVDSSCKPKTVEVKGDAQISNIQSAFGGAAIKFDGSGDYLKLPPSTDFEFGLGDFTFESWVYIEGNSAQSGNGARVFNLYSIGQYNNTESVNLYVNGSTTTTGTGFGIWSGLSNTRVSADVNIPQKSWHHLAVTRENLTVKLFLDGNLIKSEYWPINLIGQGDGLNIGGRYWPSWDYFLNGYLDDLRVIKGKAIYKDNFTPPTQELNVSEYLNSGVHPRVLNTSLQGQTNLPFNSFDVAFTNDVDASTFAAEDIVITNAQNQQITVANLTKLDSQHFNVQLGSLLLDGKYTVKIGPNIKGLNQLLLDQNGNGVGGELADVFSLQFIVDTVPPAAPTVNSYSALTGKATYVFSGQKEIGTSLLLNGVEVVPGNASTAWQYTATLNLGANHLLFTTKDNADNQSLPTAVDITYELQPPAQINPQISPLGKGTELTVSWLDYLDLLNSATTANYRIYYSKTPYTLVSQATNFVELSATTKLYKLENLTRNTTYYVSVVAIDSNGLSQTSVSPKAVSPVDNIAPTGFANLAVTSMLGALDLTWQGVDESVDDFASYKLIYTLNGQTKTLLLSKQDVGGVSAHYVLSDLSQGMGHDIKLSALDTSGNASSVAVNSGVTLMSNPTIVNMEPLNNAAKITFSAVAPNLYVKQYGIYVNSVAFNSVEGMTPTAIIPKGVNGQTLITNTITGLTNGSKVYVAVTVINESLGELKTVQSVSVTPQLDKIGPEITSANYFATNSSTQYFLDLAPEIAFSGKFSIKAQDTSKVNRLVFALDSGTASSVLVTNSSGAYEFALDVLAQSDGAHTLSVDAYDEFENVTHKEYSFTIDAAAPTVPLFTSPVNGFVTSADSIQISGTSLPDTQVEIEQSGTALAPVLVDSSGKFTVIAQLASGSNVFVAKAHYVNRSKMSANSVARSVVQNKQIPDAPNGLNAIASKQGQIQLGWNAVVSADAANPIKGYNLYRAKEAFNSTQTVGVTKLNAGLVTSVNYNDLVSVDGQYFYAVSAVNQAGNEGGLSAVASVVADSTGPKLIQAHYQPTGKYDAASGRIGLGSVQVKLTFSEPLRNTPYFAVVPNKGVPIPLELTKATNNALEYSGSFNITSSVNSGTAYAVMSAYDEANNRGTDILSGGSLVIDTQGPDVINLAVSPSEPIKVDSSNGANINLNITLNDEVALGQTVQVIPLINSVPVSGYETGVAMTRDAASPFGSPLFQGSFTVSPSLLSSGIATLSFTYIGEDDLGNQSTRINGKSQFQMYQGNLPPLATPVGLSAKALPGGKVALEWKAVDDAAGYIVYRKEAAQTEWAALPKVADVKWTDEPAVDGNYWYAVASVRLVNEQESISAKSEAVNVKADRTPPAAPSALVLEKNGAGLVSRWQAPTVDSQNNPESPTGLTYNLYRLALAKDQQQVSTSGLTPLQTRIPALIALDTKPSSTEHSYFVTAVDAAGNESAPSTTEYLSFGLLPINQLHIELKDNSYPTLYWEHSGNGIKQYKVSRTDGSLAPVLLTPEGIEHTGVATQYMDVNYNNGQVSRGALHEALYSVVALDNFNEASLAHELRLPALAVTLEKTKDVALERGVMNQVLFRVSNMGKTAAESITLYASVKENGVIRNHSSDVFDVPAGASTLVPVVIGGYAKLDALVDLNIRMEQKPKANESINIYRSETVLVGNSSLTASVETQNFVRGAKGKAQFSITNTSSVETEIVLANNSGNSASPEVRFILEDYQGNLLSTQAVKQFTGGVVSLSNGQVVARIAPNETFTSDWFEMSVPAASPDQIKLKLVVDKYHYHSAKPTHVEMAGVGAVKNVQLTETPYYAEITSVTPAAVYHVGDKVVVKGKVLSRTTSESLSNVPVLFIYNVRGFEQRVTLFSDDAGQFTWTYTADQITGRFRLSAVHPDVTDRPVQGEFTVSGGAATPSAINVKVPRNYQQPMTVRVQAGYDTQLANIRMVHIDGNNNVLNTLPVGVSMSTGTLSSVAANTTGYLPLNFSADNTASDSGTLKYRIEADNYTGSNALGSVTITYNLMQATPAVSTSPNFINTGVGIGLQSLEDLQVSNKGLETLKNATVEIATVDASELPSWITLNTASALGDIPVGESRSVQLLVKPTAGVAEGDYEFKLKIRGDNYTGYTLPIFVKVTQSGIGKAFFHVSDIYTSTIENGKLIAGVKSASIHIQNELVASESFTLNTDANGEAIFNNLPAGRYSFRATAFDHAAQVGRIWVKPGVTTSQEVFLMNNLVNVEWSVREITVEDRYEIKLEATYKTQVPAAVVVISPLNVHLPVMKKGEIFQGEFILTNHGLINAENIKQTLPSSNNLVKVEFLTSIPEKLAAGKTITLPYRVQAIADFVPVADPNASGGGCGKLTLSYVVDYEFKCVNDTPAAGQTRAVFDANWGSCPPVTTLPSGYTYSPPEGYSGYVGGIGGPSGGTSYSHSGNGIAEEPLWCIRKTECENCNQNSGSGK